MIVPKRTMEINFRQIINLFSLKSFLNPSYIINKSIIIISKSIITIKLPPRSTLQIFCKFPVDSVNVFGKSSYLIPQLHKRPSKEVFAVI